MAAERFVKIRFVGESKSVVKAAAAAERAARAAASEFEKVAIVADKASEKVRKSWDDKIAGGLAKVTSKLPGILGSAIGGLPPQGQALALVIVGGLAAALAPAIGAAISSAVLLAVGGGVLAAGIAAVAKTPRVTAAFEKLKDSMFDRDTKKIEDKIQQAQERFEKARALGSQKGMDSARYDIEKAKRELEKALSFNKLNKSFKDLFEPFIEPLVRAAKTFTGAFDNAKPAIDRMAKALAPVIDKLAPALAEFLARALPGIETAVRASVPLFNILAEKLPLIGESITRFFESISENGGDTNLFFSDLLDVVAGLIIVFGQVISKLASWYSNVRMFLRNAQDQFVIFKAFVIEQFANILRAANAAMGWMPGLGPKLRAASKQFEKFRAEANSELQKIRDRDVRVRVSSNVLSVAAQIGRTLQGLGAISGNTPRRASGGWAQKGQTFLAGENGPELITASRRMYVNSAGATAGMSSTPEVHVYIGDRELTEMIDVRVDTSNRDLRRRAGMRAGAYA